jgi:hypothetical protein
MIEQIKIIDEFEKASYDKYGSHTYSSAYFSVMLADVLNYAPEHVKKIVIEHLNEKTLELQGH